MFVRIFCLVPVELSFFGSDIADFVRCSFMLTDFLWLNELFLLDAPLCIAITSVNQRIPFDDKKGWLF